MERSPLHGKAALDAFLKGERRQGRPLVFLDFDDVICLNAPYGGYDVFVPAEQRPADLWQRLWSSRATQVLERALLEHDAQLVLTTSWLRLMDRDGFVALFERTGLSSLSAALHPQWEAAPNRGDTRHDAIVRWLHRNYEGGPFVVLDDKLSGTGLEGSRLDKAQCVVLCELHQGLGPEHEAFLHRALKGEGARLRRL